MGPLARSVCATNIAKEGVAGIGRAKANRVSLGSTLSGASTTGSGSGVASANSTQAQVQQMLQQQQDRNAFGAPATQGLSRFVANANGQIREVRGSRTVRDG